MKSTIKAFNIVLLLLCLITHVSSYAQEVFTIEIDAMDRYDFKGDYENATIIFRASNKTTKTVIDGSQATLKGNVKIKCRASNVDFVNFTFNNPKLDKANEAVFEIGEKDQSYENITVQNFKIINKVTDGEYVGFFYMNVMANNVKISNCELRGKHNRLPMIHVNSKFTNVEISSCSFKDVAPRKEEALEAIRIGDGTPSTGSYCIKNNVFEDYFGDSETISCKASNVRISGNKFINCRSGVTIRKANHVEISWNSFTNVTHPVRISGKNHKITGNSFDASSEQAISFMMGNSDYWTSENIVISKNKFREAAKIGLISNAEDGAYPTGVSFKGNYVLGKSKKKMKSKMFNKDFFEKTKPGSATEKYNIKQKTYIIK